MPVHDFSNWQFLEALNAGAVTDHTLRIELTGVRYPAGIANKDKKDRAILRGFIAFRNTLGIDPGEEVEIKLDLDHRLNTPDVPYGTHLNLRDLFDGRPSFRALPTGSVVRFQNCSVTPNDPDRGEHMMLSTTGFNVMDLEPEVRRLDAIQRPYWSWEGGALTFRVPPPNMPITSACPLRIRPNEERGGWDIERTLTPKGEFVPAGLGFMRGPRKTAQDAVALMYSAGLHESQVRIFTSRDKLAYDLFAPHPVAPVSRKLHEHVTWRQGRTGDDISFTVDDALNRYIKAELVNESGEYTGWDDTARLVVALNDLALRDIVDLVVTSHENDMAEAYIAACLPELGARCFGEEWLQQPRLPIYPEDGASYDPPAPGMK